MANIYEITGDVLLFQQMVEEGEVSDDVIADTFEALEGEYKLKVQGYCMARSNLLARKTGLLAEIERMKSQIERIDKNVDRMDKTVQKSMVKLGYDQVQTELFDVRRKKNPPSLKIDNEDLVPQIYWRTPEPKPPVPTIDKVKLKADMKAAGITANEFAHIEQEEKLIIK